MKEQNQISMDIVNPKAAGIDIGSRSHFVAIGQKEEHVREFGVYNEDLKAISNWLEEMGLDKTILDKMTISKMINAIRPL